MTTPGTDDALWRPTPERVAASNLAAFMRAAEPLAGRRLASYAELHAWSVADRPAFWNLIWDLCGVIGDKGERVLVDDDMPGASFFPDARLNFAENLLRARRQLDRPGLPRRGQGGAAPELGRAERAGVAAAAGAGGGRRRGRRPRRGDAAEHARGHRADAGHRLDRRGLVVVLARFRRARRARPLRPDRAQGVHRRRRLLVQRQAHPDRRQARRRSSPSCPPSRRW